MAQLQSFRNHRTRSLIAAICLASALFAGAGLARDEAPAPTSNRWLIEAPDEKTRTQRLEKYLRGFDQPMWEVGERYLRVHQAIVDGNFELAAYHWRKIGTTIENGLMKRPRRRPNAEAMFLQTAWPALDDALKTEDAERIRKQFSTARNACMACHVAENVPFMNDQPLFRDTAID